MGQSKDGAYPQKQISVKKDSRTRRKIQRNYEHIARISK